MAMNQNNRGFALLIAVIFMSVMLAFGLALGSLSYKQQVLASTAIESQYAFYAADAALECALYYDQQLGSFAYPASAPSSAPAFSCDNDSNPTVLTNSYGSNVWNLKYRVSLASDPVHPRCAEVSIYKPNPNPGSYPSWGNVTYIFSQGYDVACGSVTGGSSTRFASRGLQIHY